jgi:intracellular sulfur oxidation DsrE/DsrF family protein
MSKENKITDMFIRKKYKQEQEGLIEELKSCGVDTCIIKINLKATSKIKDHFIYEVTYLDDGELKTVPIIATSILSVIDVLSPYVNKGLSEQKVTFLAGSEDVVASRIKSKLSKWEEYHNRNLDN